MKVTKFVIGSMLVLMLVGCKSKTTTKGTTSKTTTKITTKNNTTTNSTTKVGPVLENDKDIIIMNTTDIHCAYAKYFGYSRLVNFKKEYEKTNYVSLVDSGDYLQGGLIGNISNGKYIIDIMNEAGYDAATIGNHEFDYGMDALSNRIDEFNGDILSCNFKYIGKYEDKFETVKPYTIKTFGIYKVGYVGVTTPETLVSSNPKNFKEDGEIAYSFTANSSTEFYNCIQNNIDACKNAGADYVILLSHTGNNEENKPYTSTDIINNTTGYVAFMDGHAHKDVNWTTVKDKNNNDILYSECGTELKEFSTLTIKKNGELETNYVAYDSNNPSEKDNSMETFINTIKADVDEIGNQVLTTIDITLKITDEDGKRLVRARETQIGNLISDAYRYYMNAEIGIVNGGGIRDDLEAGAVTYYDMMNVHPFGNVIVTKKVLGSQILDYLELVSRATSTTYDKNVGENGGFANVSGLKYSIDVTKESTVVTDEPGNFIRVDGDRRVTNVMVLENGSYVALDPNKEYVVASLDFMLSNGGDGANMFMEDELLEYSSKLDFEIVIDYIVNELHGQLATKYSTTEGRITIISE